MYCPKCGNKNEDFASFCVCCGQTLVHNAVNSSWKSAGDISGEKQQNRSGAPVQPVYSPPVNTDRHNVESIVVKHVGKSTASELLIPVIIIATVAIVAAILLSTAKKCENCNSFFWGEGHYFLGYPICDDCWH